jgi:hypothetical protein
MAGPSQAKRLVCGRPLPGEHWQCLRPSSFSPFSIISQRLHARTNVFLQGQFKSKLTCLTCGQVSLKFDPFFSLCLPLPQKKRLYADPHKENNGGTTRSSDRSFNRRHKVTFVPRDTSMDPVEFLIPVPLVGPVSGSSLFIVFSPLTFSLPFTPLKRFCRSCRRPAGCRGGACDCARPTRTSCRPSTSTLTASRRLPRPTCWWPLRLVLLFNFFCAAPFPP